MQAGSTGVTKESARAGLLKVQEALLPLELQLSETGRSLRRPAPAEAASAARAEEFEDLRTQEVTVNRVKMNVPESFTFVKSVSTGFSFYELKVSAGNIFICEASLQT